MQLWAFPGLVHSNRFRDRAPARPLLQVTYGCVALSAQGPDADPRMEGFADAGVESDQAPQRTLLCYN